MKKHALAATLTLAPLLLFLAACTDNVEGDDERNRTSSHNFTQQGQRVPSEGEETPRRLKGFDEFGDEYSAAIDNLSQTLPAGYDLADTPTGDWDPQGRYESGVGQMHAALQWQCAWLTEYVAASSAYDTEAIRDAIAHLDSWTELDEVSPYIDAGSVEYWRKQVIAPASDGDDSQLLEFARECA